VHHEVQAVVRRVAEHGTELIGPLLAAGGDDDVGAGREVGADRALAHAAGAARDEHVPSGQVGREGTAGHDDTPNVEIINVGIDNVVYINIAWIVVIPNS